MAEYYNTSTSLARQRYRVMVDKFDALKDVLPATLDDSRLSRIATLELARKTILALKLENKKLTDELSYYIHFATLTQCNPAEDAVLSANNSNLNIIIRAIDQVEKQ